MYLKKLELQGFKSFANKTDLCFNLGITAIIGPNGSGKSNIADAVRWVLGEQSAKSLRGKKSEDVIFAGSGKRAQISTASVFLYFNNKDKKIPVELEEIVIGRKIFRDGSGQYFLNENRVRLADITDILAGSGIGKGDWAVINQGMSDAILNASAIERRGILEESIGIKQFRIKKDQAERKLRATDQNTIRISDLIAEIEPRLKFLKRQAEKFEKREKIQEMLDQQQQEYYGCKMAALEKEKNIFNERKKEIILLKEKQQKNLDILEQKLLEESKQGTFGQERILKIQNRLRELSLVRRDLEKDIAILEGKKIAAENMSRQKQEEILLAQKNIDSISVKEAVNSNVSHSDDAEEVTVRKKVLNEILDLIETASEKSSEQNLLDVFGKIKKFLKNVIGAGGSKKEKEHSESHRVDLNFYNEKISGLKNQIKIEKENIKKSAQDIRRKENELEGIEKEISKIEEEAVSINREDQRRRSSFFEIERDIRISRDELDKIKQQENVVKIEEERTLVHLEDLEKEIQNELGEKFDIKNLSNAKCSEGFLGKESKIRKLKFQLEQIGGIDDLALQEYKETEERFNYLSRELEDFEQAKKNLGELIQKLSGEMEKKFNQAFKNISQEFKKYFKLIFGGGNAKIYCSRIQKNENTTDLSAVAERSEAKAEDNPINNIGIEIEAIPPGKKTKTLSMLSGGERALVSIALLFAMISSNPPPFCVLDEVDAALDETNSLRIGKIFKELSVQTQFIIITHNRGIMNQSQTLYGVTMQKDGVSQLLSVKLENN